MDENGEIVFSEIVNIDNTKAEENYGLSHSRLDRIRKNMNVPNSTDHNMRVFVRIISAKRRSALIMGNDKLVHHIDNVLRDLMLVQYGMPTDAENRIVAPQKEKRV